MLTTSPAETSAGNVAPSRTACRITTATVRKDASIRMKVISRCRINPSAAATRPTPRIADPQPITAARSWRRSPSSIALEIR